MFTIGSMVMFSGCGEEQESLHDHDHFVPAHWPEGLADAADKIGERIELLKVKGAGTEVIHEIGDLVSWAPEIAGDTDLPEEDWIPIYEVSESLSSVFEDDAVDVDQYSQQLNELQELLRSAEAKLPTVSTESEETEES